MCWRDCAANFDTASALSDVDQFTPYCIRQRFHRAFAGGGGPARSCLCSHSDLSLARTACRAFHSTSIRDLTSVNIPWSSHVRGTPPRRSSHQTIFQRSAVLEGRRSSRRLHAHRLDAKPM